MSSVYLNVCIYTALYWIDLNVYVHTSMSRVYLNEYVQLCIGYI